MLLHNNHYGTFTGRYRKGGCCERTWGFGAAVGDYDNDGWPDIYVANYGRTASIATTRAAPLRMLREGRRGPRGW